MLSTREVSAAGQSVTDLHHPNTVSKILRAHTSVGSLLYKGVGPLEE